LNFVLTPPNGSIGGTSTVGRAGIQFSESSGNMLLFGYGIAQ
jgi:hypothetical protein